MRIVKERLAEALPSCRTFLDVDDLISGSGTAEVDKSRCILVFCTSLYFEKKNSLKELYRAVVQSRSILAMLEPDATQEGGLDQRAVEALITNAKLDLFKLFDKWAEWKKERELLQNAFDHPPDEDEVRAALFAILPVEWNRLPHFQDVTIRLVAERGILQGKKGELYLQGEAAMGKVRLAPPLEGRQYHLFCSEYNAGATALAEELKKSSVFKKASAPLTFTTDFSDLSFCDHMLLLLDERTWTSGVDTAALVEHIHKAMRIGVHIACVHEFPSVVGPKRFECEFGLMFGDEWTPAHLMGGDSNLYKDIALALKGAEWRQPGLVAFATKLVSSAGPRETIELQVPTSYEARSGPNPWLASDSLEDNSISLPANQRPTFIISGADSLVEAEKSHKYDCNARVSGPPTKLVSTRGRSAGSELATGRVREVFTATQSEAAADALSSDAGQMRPPPLVAEDEMEYNARGSLLDVDQSLFIAPILPAATTATPASPSQPAIQSPAHLMLQSSRALPEPIAAMSQRLTSMLFSPDQRGDADGSTSLQA